MSAVLHRVATALTLLSLGGCALLGKADALTPRYFSPDLAGGGRASTSSSPSSQGAPVAELRLGRITAASHLGERLVFRDSRYELNFYEARRWSEEPEAFLRAFLRAVGSAWQPPSPLPTDVERGARILMAERGPWEAEVSLDELRALPFPKLVVSGGHHPAFDAICDALDRELAAERVVVAGAGHTAQRAPGFNEALVAFLERAR